MDAPTSPAQSPDPKPSDNTPDPSLPLANIEHETFAALIVNGVSGIEAAKRSQPGRVSYNVAKTQGSVWRRRPEVAARIRWLTVHKSEVKRDIPEPTPEPNRADPPKRASHPQSQSAQARTREALIDKLWTRIESGEFDSGTVTKLLEVLPSLTAEASNVPDPAAIVAYLASFAGRNGADIVRELGGLGFLARRFCEVLRVTPDDLAMALGLSPSVADGP